MLEECVKDNYYVSFHTHSYHCCRKMHFIYRLDIKFYFDKVSGARNVYNRSKVLGHGARLKVMSMTITMQVFMLRAITAAEKKTQGRMEN